MAFMPIAKTVGTTFMASEAQFIGRVPTILFNIQTHRRDHIYGVRGAIHCASSNMAIISIIKIVRTPLMGEMRL